MPFHVGKNRTLQKNTDNKIVAFDDIVEQGLHRGVLSLLQRSIICSGLTMGFLRAQSGKLHITDSVCPSRFTEIEYKSILPD